jgi:16S rRNA (cytosine967-C5)-methyltransferase
LKNYQGLYIVQDTASQLAVKALDAREGQLVIDCCACPGGKSIGAALDMNNVGEIISMDLHKNKLSLIERTAQSLGINIIKTMEHNGTSPYQEYLSKADRVICDVPCSGLGVIHKKPDIRHKNPQDIQKLPETQLKILTSASRYLKTGGRLVYSTCTLNKSENQDITDRFLKDNENYRRVSNTTLFPVLKDGVVQNDGFYIDIIERVK